MWNQWIDVAQRTWSSSQLPWTSLLSKAEQLQDIAPANLTIFLHLRRLIQIRWEIEMLIANSRWQCLLSNSQSFCNTIHPCSSNFNETFFLFISCFSFFYEILKYIFSLKIRFLVTFDILHPQGFWKLLNILVIDCFMSFQERRNKS